MIEEMKIEENHQGLVFYYKSKDHKSGMSDFHRHTELEMNIVIKGYAEYALPNQRYQLNRGNIVWLFPGQEHRLTKVDENFEMYVIVFKEQLFKNRVSGEDKYKLLSEQNPKGSFCRRVSLSAIEKLEMVCKSLCELNDQKDITSPAYHYAGQAFGFKENSQYYHSDPEILNSGLSYLMTVGWHLFLTEGAVEKKKLINPCVDCAIEFLRKCPEKDFSLIELAMKCGTCSSRLSRLFNEQVGESIVDYKNRIKLEQFIDCINNNPYSNLSEACYTVGFRSYSQFYKMFKQSFGISPKAYFSHS